MRPAEDTPRARVVVCPLTGRRTVMVRAGGRELAVGGPVDAEALAAGINAAVGRMKHRATLKQPPA